MALKSRRKAVVEQEESQGDSDLCQHVLSLLAVIAILPLYPSPSLGLTVPAVFEQERGGKDAQPCEGAAWYWPALPQGPGSLQSRHIWDFHT